MAKHRRSHRRSHRRFSSTITRIGSLLLLLGVALWFLPAAAQTATFSVFLPLIPGSGLPSVIPTPTPPPSGGPATVSGKVLNASTGNIIGGAQVCVAGTSLCDTSADSLTGGHNYTISNVPSGDRSIVVNPQPPFVPISHTFTIVAQQVNTINFALSSGVSGDEMRIVLTWNTTPQYNGINNDLDAYLWYPDSDTPIYYAHKYGNGHDCDGYPFVCMDHDYQQGFGPETMHIIHLLTATPDRYQFAVFDYAHLVGNYQNPNPVPPMTQSGAMVDVYIASGVVSFTVPQVGSDDCWLVFDYNQLTGEFTPGGLVPFADYCQDNRQ